MVASVIDQVTGDGWALYNGDSAEVMPSLPTESIDFSVYSPPFSALYTYTPSDRDMGNVRSDAEFFEHYGFVSRELLRVLKPGRIIAVHTQEIQRHVSVDGRRHRYDFPHDCIEHMEDVGFDYRGRFIINKNPQAIATRTHAVDLQFKTLHTDAAQLVPAMADHVLLFAKPGKNQTPIPAPITNEDWIRDAAPIWMDIDEGDVLKATGIDSDEEKHLCPLQLPVIERVIRLYTNPGETVLSPFAGVGSEGVGALRLGRKFIGIELKPAYFKRATRNLQEVEAKGGARDLFSMMGVEA